MKDAACLGQAPNLRKNPNARDPWFPERGQTTDEGKLICVTCAVRRDCKDYRRRSHTDLGIWGGEILKRGEKNV